MNRDAQEAITKLRENMPALKSNYSVKSLELFGSVVHDRQTKGSDIDILVEFSETIDLFMFVQLQEFLSETLGLKVDLVMKDALKPRIKGKILKEAVPV